MSSIDERIVSMKFDNAQFERGVKQTASSLDGLKKTLDMKGAAGGLKELGGSIKGLNLGSVTTAAEAVTSRLSTMGIVGVAALATIASQAVSAGMNLAKSFTLQPIMDGFNEYELKMGSIQTILANTARHGTSLDQVTASLDELNAYADKTIYNFGEMTKNIGLFTNAGITVEDATSMIKGFSNVAAASGTNAQGAAGAAYQLSQALSTGTIRLMDWRSLTNVGMGNKNMQDDLITLATTMDTFSGTGITAADVQKDFNGSLEKGWLSADLMSTYLQIMAGDLDAAEMKTLGLTDAQISGFVKQQKTAEEAATKVRTFTQLIGTIKEAIGSSWAESFGMLIGDFNEATELFTSVNDTLGEMIGASSKARNDLIKGFTDGGGREAVIEGLGNAFKALLAIIKPISEAFGQIFPPVTVKTLLDLANKFRDFTKTLIVGETTANNLKRTFAGVFAILGIGWEIVKAGLGLLGDLFGVVQDGSGGFLAFTAVIGDFLVGLHKVVKTSGIFKALFTGIGVVIGAVVGIISNAVGAIGSLATAILSFFQGRGFNFDFKFDFGPFENILKRISERFKGFRKVTDYAVAGLKGFGSIVSQVFNVLARGDFVGGVFEEDSPVIAFLFKIRDAFISFWGWIKGFFSGLDFNSVLDIFNAGLFATLIMIFRNGFISLKDIFSGGEGGGLLDSIKDVFGGLTDTLTAMQNNLKANVLIKIAAAIALLAGAALLLSMIDSEDLTKSLTAMAVMFTQLFTSMAIFEKVATGTGFAKMPFIAASMILLGVAINILAVAVKQMSSLSWDEMLRGLTGLGVVLAALAGWATVMNGKQSGLIRSAAAMILVGAAIKILASAVEDMSGLSWDEMIRGLVGVAAVLGAMAVFGKLGGGGTIKGAIATTIVAASLLVLASALEKFSRMDPDGMVVGLVGIAAALAIIAGSMRLMTSAIMGAASLLIVSASLWVLVPLLIKMGEMSWEEIGKAAVTLGASLGIIAAAMALMSGAIMGAASMLIVVAALWVLVPLLVTMGTMTWNEIAKASVMLLAALGLIAAGMYLMTGIIAGAASMLVVVAALWVLVPLLVTMGEMSWEEIGKAVVILGASLAIIAAGMYLMTGALPGAAALLVVAASLWVLTPVLMALSALTWGELLVGLAGLAGVFLVLGVAGLVLAPVVPALLGLGAAIALIGLGAALAGAGMLAFAVGFTALVGAVTLGTTAVVNFLQQLINLIPQVGSKIGQAIVNLIAVIGANAPIIAKAFYNIVSSFLTTIRALAPQIGATLSALLQTLLGVIRDNAPGFRSTMVVVIQQLLIGINQVAPSVINTLMRLINLLLDALQRNMPGFVNKGMNIVISILNGIARRAGEMATSATNIIVNFLNGIARNMPRIVTAGVNVVVSFINGVSQQLPRITNSAMNLIITFVNSLANSIRNNQERMRAAGKNLAGAIIDGMTGGLLSGASKVVSAAKDVASDALSSAKDFLGIHSPSREFFKLGEFSSEGMALGLAAHSKRVADASKGIGGSALAAMRKSISGMGSMLDSEMDIAPTITPVLDLTKIKNGSGNIAAILGDGSISLAGISHADSILSDMNSSQFANDNTSAPVQNVINYTQNNTSPQALSAIEIYRQTKNQLSTIKGRVNNNVESYSS